MKAITTLLLAAAGTALAGPVDCTYGGLERSVEVVYADPGHAVPCEVLYEKPMEDGQHTLWRAENEEGYCEAQAEAFVAKLAAMGWSCEEASAPEPIVVKAEENAGVNEAEETAGAAETNAIEIAEEALQTPE